MRYFGITSYFEYNCLDLEINTFGLHIQKMLCLIRFCSTVTSMHGVYMQEAGSYAQASYFLTHKYYFCITFHICKNCINLE
jgi:hypothetical protein